MKKSLLPFLFALGLSGASLIGCSTKGDQTQRDTSLSPGTHQSTAEAGDDEMMPMSGNINLDMQLMGQHMVQKLGAADDNYDDRFINLMIPHHEGAILMAQDAQKKAQHPELKKFADSIITVQNSEIGQLRTWDNIWYNHSPKDDSMMVMENQKMAKELGDAGANYDLQFLNGMIPHHESAVAMANDALSKSKHADLKKMAQGIIASQQKEIDQMKAWKKQWYNQ